MLQILREKAHGAIAWIIVLFIAIAFVFFGLGDYFSGRGNREIAAKINDQKISWQAVDKIYKRLAPQYETQMDEDTLKNQILMQLIRRSALIKEIRNVGFRVGDEQVAELLVNIPAFQVDGKFSKEQYLKILSEANYTEVGFRQELLQDALLGQLEQGIMQSSFATPVELKKTVEVVDQKRDFGYMLVSASKHKKDVKISENQIKAYYDKHKANFIKPEQVVLEYVELSLSQLAADLKPTTEEVTAFYKANKPNFAAPERVHARHILMSVPEGNIELDAKAKEKILRISVELKKGADFAKLAKANSSDVGSAKNGGDLGWFVRGQMVPEFEKAAFELKKPNSITGPVKTQFGYHLIQLVEHKDAEVRSLNEVKSLIEAQLKRDKAEVIFAEKAEILAKLGFEQPSLEPIAKQLGLVQKETAAFSLKGGEGIASHPEVLKLAFSDLLVKEKRNSEPVKISQDTVIIMRVKNHEAAVQETLSEASQRISNLLVGEAARELAKINGEKTLKEVQSGNMPVSWITKTNVIRSAVDPSREIVLAAFEIPEFDPNAHKSSFNGFSLPNGDYLVLALNKIKQGDWSSLPLDIQGSYRKGLTEFSSQLEYALYANQVMQAAKIQIFKDPV